MTTNTATRLMTYKDVADHLGQSVRQVMRYTSMGVLACVKVGQAVRFRPEDVAVFVNSHRLERRVPTYRGIPADYLPPMIQGEASYHG